MMFSPGWLFGGLGLMMIVVVAIVLFVIPVTRDFTSFGNTTWWNARSMYVLDRPRRTTASLICSHTIGTSFRKPVPKAGIRVISYHDVPVLASRIDELITSPTILVIGWGADYGTSNFRAEIRKIVNCPYIQKVYANNVDCGVVPGNNNLNHKIVPLPLGVDYHTKAFVTPSTLYNYRSWPPTFTPASQQDCCLQSIATGLPPTRNRPTVAYTTAHLQQTDTTPRHQYSGHRKVIQELFGDSKATPHVRLDTKVSREESWKRHGDAFFILSPPGNGLDCHRTWEALILGSVPIVISDPAFNPVFDDLPVVLVDSYAEVTPENLARWKTEIVSKLDSKAYQLEKLTTAYWMNRIQAGV